jgi:hypothetical protein
VAAYTPIVRARVGLVVRVALLDAPPRWFLMHRIEAHSRHYPCLGGAERCPYHDAPQRWYGYLPCWDLATRKLALAEVTPLAWQTATEGIADPAFTWKGRELHLLRAGEHANSPVRLDVRKVLRGADRAAEAPNVAQLLARIWFGTDPAVQLDAVIVAHQNHRACQRARRSGPGVA